MTVPDSEASAAVSALVFRLRNRGNASEEQLAAEFITALRERGWRPPLAPATDDNETAGTREASRELLALACATRPGWTDTETWNAILAAKTAGLPWDRLVLRLMAIALREEDPPTRPRELWDDARGLSGRAEGRSAPAGHHASAIAALRAGNYAAAWSATHDGAVPPQIARVTGPLTALTDDNDNRETA